MSRLRPNLDKPPKPKKNASIGFISERKSNICTAIIFAVIIVFHVCVIFIKKAEPEDIEDTSRPVTLRIAASVKKAVQKMAVREEPPPKPKEEPPKPTESPVKEYVPEEESEPEIEQIESEELAEVEEEASEIEEEFAGEYAEGASEGDYDAEGIAEGDFDAGASEYDFEGETYDESEGYSVGLRNLEYEICMEIEKNKIYPAAARKRGFEGEVELWFTVNTDGSLGDLQVLSATGNKLLTDSALKAVQKSFPVSGFEIRDAFEMSVILVFKLESA